VARTTPILSPVGSDHGTTDFSAIRRRSDRLPVQRVLGVNNAVVAADVRTVTRLDTKVWELAGAGPQERLIVKLENPVGGETTQQFEHRHAHVTFLAQQALQGVPDASPLTQAELAEIATLTPAAVGNDVTDLQQFIAAPHGLVFLKVTKVEMGKHLDRRIRDVQAAFGPQGRKLKSGKEALDALSAQIRSQAVLRALGRMAAFDLVVNNADRFRPEGTVNPKNIDFSDTNAVIPIDNLDPNNRIDPTNPNDWQARQHMTSRAGIDAWAVLAVEDLAKKVSYAGDPFGDLYNDFVTGMYAGVVALKAQQGQMQGRANATADPHSKALATEIARRLGLLP
jgi:hypothetical protein